MNTIRITVATPEGVILQKATVRHDVGAKRLIASAIKMLLVKRDLYCTIQPDEWEGCL